VLMEWPGSSSISPGSIGTSRSDGVIALLMLHVGELEGTRGPRVWPRRYVMPRIRPRQ
jgi:hypothetical protein